MCFAQKFVFVYLQGLCTSDLVGIGLNLNENYFDHTMFTHVVMIGNTNPANAKKGIKTVNLILLKSVFEKLFFL